jgi:hypothetical protein
MNPHRRSSTAISAAVVGFGLMAHCARAGTYQTISIDGSFSDWMNVPVAVTAAPNAASPIDPVQLKMANDSTNIYFELTFNGAQNPQYDSGVFLGIDSDNSASTGFNIFGSSQIGSNFGFQNDYPFTQTASSFNSGGSFSNTTYSASPYDTATTMQEISIPLSAYETDTSAGGYTGPIFNTSSGSFTVEFYTTESTASVLGPYTYTIAGPPVKGTYALTGSGDFNQGSSWSAGTVPAGMNAEADFLGSITANHTIYSDTAITLGTIVFNNSSFTYVLGGAGSLTLQVSSGSALVDAQAGTHKITLPTEIASNTTFNADSGATLVIQAPVTVDPGISLTETGAGTVQFLSTITVDTGGSISLAATSNALSLSLNDASTAALISNTTTTKTALQLEILNIASGSSFDLSNNDLIMHAGSLASVNAQVAAGYNGSNWNGSGIVSSAAAADSTHLTTLGVIQNSTASGSAMYTTFDNVSVGAGDVLVKYTYYGDTNLDGKVDGSDYSRIDNGSLTGATGWANGDFNYDGVINGSDYTLIDNAYNTQGGQIGSNSAAQITAQIAGISAVPEPGSLSLVCIAAAGLLGRRIRKVREPRADCTTL